MVDDENKSHHINYVSIHTKARLLVTNYLPATSLPLYLSTSATCLSYSYLHTSTSMMMSMVVVVVV
jgi:hypothetical protein